MEIRKIRKEDYTEARALIQSIMTDEFSEDVDAYPCDDLHDIGASYGNLGEAFFVIEDDGRIIGTVGIKREDERAALLRRIFVDPEKRRKQYGAKLIERAIAFCREVGYQEIVFKTTSRMQGAIHLCQQKGFVEKAHIRLGGIELYKFTLFLKENSPLCA